MNIYDEHPFKVILDYGHNPAAVEAMCVLVDRLEVTGRRIAVLSAPGDRRDEDIAELGRIAAGHFDYFICRRDDQLRGRAADEVPKLLQKALLENGVEAERVSIVPEEAHAVDAALREGRPGDLVLIFGDAITRSWKQVIQFRPDATALASERTRISQPEMAMAGITTVLDDKRREFVRDTRGVRIARGEMDD